MLYTRFTTTRDYKLSPSFFFVNFHTNLHSLSTTSGEFNFALAETLQDSYMKYNYMKYWLHILKLQIAIEKS